MTQKSAEQDVKGEIATRMRKLISPFFQQAVEGALATQDVEAFWEEVEAAICTGIDLFVAKLSKEAEQEAARLDEEWKLVEGMGWTEFAIWLREKARTIASAPE